MTVLSMGYLTLGDLDPFEMVVAAAAGGFRASGIRLTGHKPGDPWGFDPSRPSDVARMRALAQDAGLALTSACSYRFGPDAQPADYASVLDACAALCIPVLVCNAFDPDLGLVRDRLAAVADLAAPHGIRLAVEFIPVSAIRSLPQALEMVDATGRGNIGVIVDALHLWRSGGTPDDLRKADPARLIAVQLCDAPLVGPSDPEGLKAEMRGGRLLPGEGGFDLRGVLSALPSGVEIEVEVPDARTAHLPPTERAARVFAATQAYIDAHHREVAQ